MKREIALLVILACSLTGCGGSPNYENPYRVDTVIQIPVDPTEPPTEPAPTDAPTEPEETAAEETQTVKPSVSSGSASTGSKTTSTKTSSKSSGTSTSKTSTSKTTTAQTDTSNSTAKTTEPPSAEPVETKSVETQPHLTEPPTTEPPATEPPTTEPPATESPATEPPATEPPATEPPVTEPPETQLPTEPAYDPTGYTAGALEYAVLDQINAYREEAGAGALSMDTGLCTAASVRAFEISSLWSHTRPDGRGYATVLSDFGYGYGDAAENLIYVSGSGDAAAMVAKWMGSEKNKSTLLSEDFTVAGIGIYRANGMTYLANLLIG